jgi:acetyl-CoA carboxylase alpha subunit
MALIPDNPVLPTPPVTVTQINNVVEDTTVSFTVADAEILWQAKEAARQDTHDYVSGYIANTPHLTGGALDKLINAIVVGLASQTVTK